jgi:hypothetical protein
MSDCLTTGVLPWNAEDKEKRENTVYVRPFWGAGATEEKAALLEPGSKVGVLGEEGLVETNPRDLTWDEFVKMKFLVGKVLGVGALSESMNPPSDNIRPFSLSLDFGAEEGQKDALVYLRSGFVTPEELLGRQVLAIVNLASTDGENHDDGKAKAAVGSRILVLTVGGKTTLEPAKEVENGFRLG